MPRGRGRPAGRLGQRGARHLDRDRGRATRARTSRSRSTRRSRSRSSRSSCRPGSPTAPSASPPSSWTRTRARSFAYASYPSYDANDYQAIAAEDPARFVDPIVSTVYEPGSVFKMMTATAALGHGTVTTKTKIRDTGTLRVDGGRARVDDADHKAMGVMTFEDAVAYSRNVVAAKVALKLGQDTRRVAADRCSPRGARWASGDRPGSTSPTRCGGLVRDPAVDPVAPDRPRERGLRPGRSRSRRSSSRRPSGRCSTAASSSSRGS